MTVSASRPVAPRNASSSARSRRYAATVWREAPRSTSSDSRNARHAGDPSGSSSTRAGRLSPAGGSPRSTACACGSPGSPRAAPAAARASSGTRRPCRARSDWTVAPTTSSSAAHASSAGVDATCSYSATAGSRSPTTGASRVQVEVAGDAAVGARHGRQVVRRDGRHREPRDRLGGAVLEPRQPVGEDAVVGERLADARPRRCRGPRRSPRSARGGSRAPAPTSRSRGRVGEVGARRRRVRPTGITNSRNRPITWSIRIAAGVRACSPPDRPRTPRSRRPPARRGAPAAGPSPGPSGPSGSGGAPTDRRSATIAWRSQWSYPPGAVPTARSVITPRRIAQPGRRRAARRPAAAARRGTRSRRASSRTSRATPAPSRIAQLGRPAPPVAAVPSREHRERREPVGVGAPRTPSAQRAVEVGRRTRSAAPPPSPAAPRRGRSAAAPTSARPSSASAASASRSAPSSAAASGTA